ncbi:integrin alpha-ps-like protein, partial [Dinothrombium tinctorium]
MLIRYHLGSIALGSLLVASVKMIRYLFKKIDTLLSRYRNSCDAFGKCCRCCLWITEKFLTFINKNAYIEIGETSAKYKSDELKAFQQISSNALRVLAINGIGDLLLFLAKLCVVVSTVFIGTQLIEEKASSLRHSHSPLFVCAFDAFNFEPRLPVIKHGPSNRSYFGYSVAEHLVDSQSGEAYILVGAPRAQSEQPGTYRSGVVYKCNLTTYRKDCVPLRIDQDEREPSKEVSKDDQWLGVTVKSQGPGGYVMACAHRYVIKGADFRWGFGICYSLSKYLDYDRAWEPCYNRPVGKAHEEFGFCQAGTSGEISEDNEIIIGAPGPYTWRGTIFKNTVSFRAREDKRWYFGPLDNESPVDKYSYLGMSVTSGRFFGKYTSFASGAPRANGTGRVVLFGKQQNNATIEVKLILSGEQLASSFGYTIASLDCNGDNKTDLVVGAPFYYSEDEGGAVYIYMNQNNNFDTNYSLKLTGKFESRFGFALTNLGDINKDGFQDLAIGAPYEGNGVVYIYLGSPNGIKEQPAQIIRASDLPEEAQIFNTFGYSLSGSQDMDGNGYPDLLVGAYESDAVVLLRARPILDIVTSITTDVKSINPNEIGCAQDIYSKLTCFSIEACFKFNSSNIFRVNALALQYRIEADFGKKYYRVYFNSSSETDTPNIVQRSISLSRNELGLQQCSKELVYIKDKSDIHSPIKFKLSYSLLQERPRVPKEGEPLPKINDYPILNQEEALKIYDARFLKNCGTNDICESQLEVSAELHLNKTGSQHTLYLGTRDVNITVKVANLNEPAYDANLYIFYPESLNFGGTKKIKGEQVDCRVPHNGTVVRCELGNPFKEGDDVEILFRFDPKETFGNISKLNIFIEANTTSKNISPHKSTVSLEAKVVRMAELELKGYADRQSVLYGGKVRGESGMHFEDDIGSIVTHSFVVYNRGPWNVKRLEVVVNWPYEVESRREHGKRILYLMKRPEVQDDGDCILPHEKINPLNITESPISDNTLDTYQKNIRVKREMVVMPEKIEEDGKIQNIVTFDCERGTAKCFTFTCFINDLRADQSAIVKIRARLWNPTFVEDYAHGVSQVHIISHAKIRLDPVLDIVQDRSNDYASAKTKAIPDLPSLPPEGPPLWVIILAIFLGILLLLIVIYILWKIGFFKRKKPAKGYMPANTDDKDFNSYG